MENNENKTIQQMLEHEIVELTILRGEAPKQEFPSPVSIEGAIDTPAKFIANRKTTETFDKLKSHAILKKGSKCITLIVNEQSTRDKYVITGKFSVSKIFASLGINEISSYTPEKLANILKLLRSIFPERSEHATIVSTLRSLKAKVNRETEESDDRRGNINNRFIQTVESNMPESFKLRMPLFEGGDEKTFEVSVILEADSSNSIKCLLESVEAAELMDEEVDEKFEIESKKLSKEVLVIEA